MSGQSFSFFADHRPSLYVATNRGSIFKSAATGGGNTSFISSIVTPYALAVGGPNGNFLYVTNNPQNSNGNFYISTYTADTGALINANFIQIATAGLYGLALSKDNTILYVSVYSGSPPGVYTYAADTGQPLNLTGQPIQGLFVPVNEPWGIAIEANTLYVASHQDSAIYEFDATTGDPTGSITRPD